MFICLKAIYHIMCFLPNKYVYVHMCVLMYVENPGCHNRKDSHFTTIQCWSNVVPGTNASSIKTWKKVSRMSSL